MLALETAVVYSDQSDGVRASGCRGMKTAMMFLFYFCCVAFLMCLGVSVAALVAQGHPILALLLAAVSIAAIWTAVSRIMNVPEVRTQQAQTARAPRKAPAYENQESSVVSLPHATRPIQVWIDADLGIADLVVYLNTIPGVRTWTSCQGTIGEGGRSPYRPYVMCAWSDGALVGLQEQFDITELGPGWGYVHPRPENPEARTQQADHNGIAEESASIWKDSSNNSKDDKRNIYFQSEV
jgi:hypothetical protein